MINRIVLDSWAILAWLDGEPAGEMVRDILAWAGGDDNSARRVKRRFKGLHRRPELFVNLINLGEVLYVLTRRVGEAEARMVVGEIQAGPIEVVEVSEELVFLAASFKADLPIAYADAFAVATAETVGGGLLTGDPELESLTVVPLLWLGD